MMYTACHCVINRIKIISKTFNNIIDLHIALFCLLFYLMARVFFLIVYPLSPYVYIYIYIYFKIITRYNSKITIQIHLVCCNQMIYLSLDYLSQRIEVSDSKIEKKKNASTFPNYWDKLVKSTKPLATLFNRHRVSPLVIATEIRG